MKRYFLVFLLLSAIIAGEEIERFSLPNGVECILIKKEIPTFSIGFLIKGGVSKLKKGEDGIEYLLLKSMIKGTQKITYPSFLDTLENYGIETNIISSYDYSLLNLKSIKKFIKKTIYIASLILTEPEFNKKAIERAKEEIITELRKQKEDPDEEIWEIVNEEFYKEHPYKIKPKGKIETIKNFSAEILKKYYDTHINSGEIIIGCVGDFEKREIKELLEKLFSGVKKGKYKEKEIPPFSMKGKKFIKKKRENLQTSYFVCKFPAPYLQEKEYIPLYLLTRILSHKLWNTLRTESGLTYSTYSGISKKKANYGYMYFSSVNPDSAFKLLMQETERVKEGKISENEILKTINSSKTSFLSEIAYTDRFLTTTLVDGYLTGDPEFSFKVFEKMEKISPDELQKIAKKYLRKENFFIAFLIKNSLK